MSDSNQVTSVRNNPSGVTRRSFLKFSGGTAAAFPFLGPSMAAPVVASTNPLINCGLVAYTSGLEMLGCNLSNASGFFLNTASTSSSAATVSAAANPLLSFIGNLGKFSPGTASFIEPNNLQNVVYFFNPAQRAYDTIPGNGGGNALEAGLKSASEQLASNRQAFITDPAVRRYISDGNYQSHMLGELGVDGLARKMFNDIQHSTGVVYRSMLDTVRGVHCVQGTLPQSSVARQLGQKLGTKFPGLRKVNFTHDATNGAKSVDLDRGRVIKKANATKSNGDSTDEKGNEVTSRELSVIRDINDLEEPYKSAHLAILELRNAFQLLGRIESVRLGIKLETRSSEKIKLEKTLKRLLEESRRNAKKLNEQVESKTLVPSQ